MQREFLMKQKNNDMVRLGRKEAAIFEYNCENYGECIADYILSLELIKKDHTKTRIISACFAGAVIASGFTLLAIGIKTRSQLGPLLGVSGIVVASRKLYKELGDQEYYSALSKLINLVQLSLKKNGFWIDTDHRFLKNLRNLEDTTAKMLCAALEVIDKNSRLLIKRNDDLFDKTVEEVDEICEIQKEIDEEKDEPFDFLIAKTEDKE